MMDDTTPEAKRHYYGLLRKATPEFRAERMHKLSRMTKEIALDSIRRRHPEYAEEQIKYAYLRLIMGKNDFEHNFPGITVCP